jgi:hypothetical protein
LGNLEFISGEITRIDPDGWLLLSAQRRFGSNISFDAVEEIFSVCLGFFAG